MEIPKMVKTLKYDNVDTYDIDDRKFLEFDNGENTYDNDQIKVR